MRTLEKLTHNFSSQCNLFGFAGGFLHGPNALAMVFCCSPSIASPLRRPRFTFRPLHRERPQRRALSYSLKAAQAQQKGLCRYTPVHRTRRQPVADLVTARKGGVLAANGSGTQKAEAVSYAPVVRAHVSVRHDGRARQPLDCLVEGLAHHLQQHQR